MNAIVSAAVTPITTGGLVRLNWITPADAAYDHVVVLRKDTNDIVGIHDPYAIRVYVGQGTPCPDFELIVNRSPALDEARFRAALDNPGPAWGATAYYAFYACNSDETQVSTSVVKTAVIPAISTLDEIDVVDWLITYLSAYLARQISEGNCQLPTRVSSIPVMDGPVPLEVPLPCVAIHLDHDAGDGYVIGDMTGGDERGMLTQLAFRIEAWCDSPETRRSIYRAVKGGLLSARVGLGELGSGTITLTGQYMEEIAEKNFLFLAVFQMGMTIPTGVTIQRPGGVIETITATVTPTAARVQ